ncbi:MAG: hypothetical protein ACREYF_15150, partial [Gammaproteobacteria bacterium]
ARKLLLVLRERIRGGGSLSDAMQAQGDAFSSLYINLVKAGEACLERKTQALRLDRHRRIHPDQTRPVPSNFGADQARLYRTA